MAWKSFCLHLWCVITLIFCFKTALTATHAGTVCQRRQNLLQTLAQIYGNMPSGRGLTRQPDVDEG
eukprot:3718995-Amphidinium_carterae.1